MNSSNEKYFELAAIAESKRVSVDGYFVCPCCDGRTLGEAGVWEICSACGWEDDPAQESDPNLTGGANGLSLFEARSNFSRIGYSDPVALRRKQPLPLP
jgi:Cysteine-rich CPCC